MSDLSFLTKPIPINYVKSQYSFNDPNNNDANYVYNLNLIMKDGSKRTFFKIEKKKNADLIDLSDNIEYNAIDTYSIEISKLPFEKDKFFKINEYFNNQVNSYSKRSNDIYIEFTQNSMCKTICKCYFIGVDFNSMFISPPN